MNVICPYCERPAFVVDGLAIYPHRPDLKEKLFWLCSLCAAYVGCHPNTQRPLGRLANAELRKWKQKAHAAFDPWWKCGRFSRKAAYSLLSKLLGIPLDETHIGMFDVATCKRVVVIAAERGKKK